MAPRTVAGPVAADVLELLLAWLPGRRWYPEKGTAAVPEPIGTIPLVDPEGAAEVGLQLLRLTSGAVLQVPLVLRPTETDRPGALGTVLREGVALDVLDACADPAFLRGWLAAAEQEAGTALPLAPGDLDRPGAARVLSGEQSNTSVLLPLADPPAILKVFRLVGAGENPDVAVPAALHRAGWTGVPRPLAWLSGTWPHGDPVHPDEPATATPTVTGHLGVVSELVVGARDGFELACDLARAGEPFDRLARSLGRTTAQLHAALRSALPADPRPAAGDAVLGVLRARAAAAVEAVPDLAPRAEAVARVLAGVADLDPLPALQRVHGDYHLGQVLHSPDRGWFVLDFEGEPAASPAERERPDLALRDLAGMLRSLDYAAAVGEAAGPAWLAAARAALVEGYLEESVTAGTAVDAPTMATVLTALELDKALYEAVYETRNRPSWLPIPLAGIDRLVEPRTS